jgi:hypothetical protein
MAVTEECLLKRKNPVHTSQETHYFTATEANLLMLCRICGFHGGDYEEYSLLVYRRPVRTSQETHYVSAKKFSRITLNKISVFMAVIMKNAVYCDVTPCGSCKNRCFGGT